MVSREEPRVLSLVIGVDTHKDEHVAVALDQLGARRSQRRIPASAQGYLDLERWASSLGVVTAFGIEGTGSYGAGLARFLVGVGHTVIEVNRSDRSARRRLGKSDPTDAELAARAVLSRVAHTAPKSGTAEVEMIRMLKSAKNSATKARTQAMNQMKMLLVTAPAEVRQGLDQLTARSLVSRCLGRRPGPLVTPAAAAKRTLRSLARRYRQLTLEIEELVADLERLTSAVAPALIKTFGVGADSAAALLIAAGDNPERLKSEAAFAALCGVSPIPASSGKTNRHRLNRGGDRQANAALYRVVIVRLRYEERTRAYMRRRTGEGRTKAEVIRCLKRYVAREVFVILKQLSQSTHPTPLDTL